MPKGSTKLDEKINNCYGLNMEEDWFEDSYITQPDEWEGMVHENDRFLEELNRMGEGDNLYKYQLTWSDKDEDFDFNEDEGFESDEISNCSTVELPQEIDRVTEKSNVDSEEALLISLEQETEKPGISRPSKNKVLETLFYNKHSLETIQEERSDLDNLIECRDSFNTEGQELSEENRGFKLLEKLGWKQGTGLGRGGQGRHFPINVKGQKNRLGLGAYKESWSCPQKTSYGVREEWLLGNDKLCFIETFDPGGILVPFSRTIGNDHI